MKNRILKLAFGALVLAGLAFAGYRYMQQQDNVEVQSASSLDESYVINHTSPSQRVQIQSIDEDDGLMDDDQE